MIALAAAGLFAGCAQTARKADGKASTEMNATQNSCKGADSCGAKENSCKSKDSCKAENSCNSK